MKADELFAAYNAQNLMEDRLCDLLSGLGIQWEDFHYDPYDFSLEIYSCAPDYVMPVEHKQALKDWGFGQVWTHTSGKDDKNFSTAGENWYSLNDFSKERVGR